MERAAEMPPYAVYSKVAEQSTKSFFMELAGTAFTYWLAGIWRLGAQLIFWAFLLFTALEALHTLGTVGAGVATARTARREGVAVEGVKWLYAASAVKVVSLAVSCVLLFVLYRRIW